MKRFIIAFCFALLLLPSCTKTTDYVDRWDVTKTEYYFDPGSPSVTNYDKGTFYWLFYEDCILLHRDESLPSYSNTEKVNWWTGMPFYYTWVGDKLVIDGRGEYIVERSGKNNMVLDFKTAHLRIYLERH